MNQLNAQYQLIILHNSDTGMWNIVLVYIKDILRGELGEYPPFSLHPPKSEKSENLGVGAFPFCERRACFL